jgi:hypothetical protein
LNKDKEWGVVSHLELHADTFSSLKAACTIGLSEHGAAVGWNVIEHGGPPILCIHWSTEESDNKFLSHISDPEDLANMVWKWLKEKGRYDQSKCYDTDGDLKQGYIVTMSNLPSWRVMFKVIPEYIVYGK